MAEAAVNIEPWIGDATPTNRTSCSFSAGALGDGLPCTAAPSVHILSESAIHGDVALSACDKHAPIARSAGLLLDEHPYGWGCSGQESWWSPAGYCLTEALDDGT